jgi:uncharacterized iron-regulated membrane protein
MKLRKLLFWLHLVTGIAAGLVVLVMSVTGAILAFAPEITGLAERSAATEPLKQHGPPLAPEPLIAQMLEHNIAVTSMTFYSDRSKAAEIYSDDGMIFVSRYTGQVLGKPATELRDFFRAVTRWHRQLAFSRENRATGRSITHAANFLLAFLTITGLYVWWPRRWTFRHLRSAAWFRFDFKAKARNFNWHRAAGFWCLIPLTVIVVTGLLMSYQWANRILYTVTGTPPVAAEEEEEPDLVRVSGQPLALDKLWTRSQTQVPDWKSISFEVPEPDDAEISFSIDASNGSRPDKRSTLTLSRYSGSVTGWDRFATLSAARQVRSMGRYAHTGQLAGPIGQTLAAVACLFCALLVWTGFSLSLHRLRAAQARKAKNHGGPSPARYCNKDMNVASVASEARFVKRRSEAFSRSATQ